MKKGTPTDGQSPSRLIDAKIKQLDDWRGKTLAHVRALIKQADPEAIEEWKWRGVPVWSHDGLICTGETYKTVVKLTFAKGASIDDPSGLFNASLEGNTRRAIDLHEADEVDADAFKTLIRAAVAMNKSKARSVERTLRAAPAVIRLPGQRNPSGSGLARFKRGAEKPSRRPGRASAAKPHRRRPGPRAGHVIRPSVPIASQGIYS